LNITCLQVVDDYPVGVVFGGTLVLGGYQDDPAFLWNLETGEKIDLPDNAFHDFAVSPDGKHLAFTVLGDPDSWIRIIKADGQQRSIAQIENWSGINQWLDDENLIIDQTSETIRLSVVLSTTSGQEQKFTPNYPEIYLIDVPYRGWGGFAYTASVLDPLLSRVVYPATISENPSGSTAVQTTSGGTLSASMKYKPWGGERDSSGTMRTTFRFTRQRRGRHRAVLLRGEVV
jgi:WD40 repeat protein